jgi:hypothetical protein
MHLLRFRLRTLLIVVLVCGMIFGLIAQSRRLTVLKNEYNSLARHRWISLVKYDDVYRVDVAPDPDHVRFLAHRAAMRHYHWSLFRKYDSAASHPWRPIEPDPPATEP